MSFLDSASAVDALNAAKKGCAQCGGPVRIPPSGDPFSSGAHRGRYLCYDCWILHWYEHPEELADAHSREYVVQQTSLILAKRGSEILFEEEGGRVFLTDRGTLLVLLKPSHGCAADEFDPERFQLLVRAMAAVEAKGIPGFPFSGIPAA